MLGERICDSVGVVPFFIVALIVCVSFVIGHCFVTQYFVSFLVLQSYISLWKRKLAALIALFS